MRSTSLTDLSRISGRRSSRSNNSGKLNSNFDDFDVVLYFRLAINFCNRSNGERESIKQEPFLNFLKQNCNKIIKSRYFLRGRCGSPKSVKPTN